MALVDEIGNVTSLSDLLKTVYGPTYVKQFEEEAILWNRLPRSSDSIGGKGFTGLALVDNSQGGAFRGETDRTPDDIATKQDQYTITSKNYYHRISLTGEIIAKAKLGDTSFANSLELQMNSAYNQSLEDLNRASHGDGFGALAVLSATSDTLSTSATWDVTCNNDRGLRHLSRGQLVDFYESGAVDESSVASKISELDYDNNIVIMAKNDGAHKATHPRSGFTAYTIAANTIASAAVMVAMGTRDASFTTSDTSYEMMGLLGIFDDSTLITTFQGIDASSNYFWRAGVLGNSGTNRALTEDLLIQACQRSRAVSGRTPDVAYLDQGQYRNLANLYLPDVVFNAQQLKGGWVTLEFAIDGSPIEFVVDPFGQPNRIFFTRKDVIKKYILEDMGWLDKMHLKEGYDQWTSLFGIRGNIGVEQRNQCTMIKDLTQPSF